MVGSQERIAVPCLPLTGEAGSSYRFAEILRLFDSRGISSRCYLISGVDLLENRGIGYQSYRISWVLYHQGTGSQEYQIPGLLDNRVSGSLDIRIIASLGSWSRV